MDVSPATEPPVLVEQSPPTPLPPVEETTVGYAQTTFFSELPKAEPTTVGSSYSSSSHVPKEVQVEATSASSYGYTSSTEGPVHESIVETATVEASPVQPAEVVTTTAEMEASTVGYKKKRSGYKASVADLETETQAYTSVSVPKKVVVTLPKLELTTISYGYSSSEVPKLEVTTVSYDAPTTVVPKLEVEVTTVGYAQATSEVPKLEVVTVSSYTSAPKAIVPKQEEEVSTVGYARVKRA